LTLLERHLGRLKGRNAWISGGKRIGRTVALTLAEQGVNLVLSYRRSRAEAERTAEAAGNLGVQALAIEMDVADRQSVEQAIERARGGFPQIDILVNLASVYETAAIDETGEREWKANMDAHIFGTFWPVQLIAPLMPSGGHIINVADATSIGRPQRMHVAYSATKAAVAAMTSAMALEYGDRGLFVNALAPGPVLPPEDFPREKWQRLRERSPVKFPVSDEEAVEQFALLVLYLSVTTMSSGHIYPLDQGQNLR
jgi:NAD(P)-dependent dehydrogenase (short-subunit alcohol dehydrogenase family)